MKNFESTIQSRLEYLEEFTRHLTCNVSTTPFVPGGATNGRAVCDVSAAWMASSLENAMKRIPDSSVTVPGFRAGKAPLELMRRRKAGQAHQLMMDWVLQDITEVLDAHVDFQLLSEVTLEVSEPWTSGKRLTVEAAFFACPYPAITLDEIVSAIAAKGLREGISLGFERGVSLARKSTQRCNKSNLVPHFCINGRSPNRKLAVGQGTHPMLTMRDSPNKELCLVMPTRILLGLRGDTSKVSDYY
jgi:hypothetical protein